MHVCVRTYRGGAGGGEDGLAHDEPGAAGGGEGGAAGLGRRRGGGEAGDYARCGGGAPGEAKHARVLSFGCWCHLPARAPKK